MPDGADLASRAPAAEPPLRLTDPLPGSAQARQQQARQNPARENPARENPAREKQEPRPAAAQRPVAAPAGGTELGAPAARPRRRHWLAALGFALMVAAPTALSGLYLGFVAADRYGSSTAFSVRSNEVTAPLEILGTVTQLGNSSAAIDGQILYDYIRSQKIVERLRAELPIEDYWNRAPDDPLFSLGRGQPVEEITDYWNRMVDVALDPASGILTVEARAFRPEEAQAVAQGILDASADLVNRLTETARLDAVSHARRELEDAEARLREIRSRLRRFRDTEQEVDPAQNARVAIELVAGLEEELAQAQVQLDLLRGELSERAPRIGQLRRRIATLEGRIAAERTRLGSGTRTADTGDPRALARIVGDYEELVVDREFAEQAYTLALATYEQAQAEARRRQRYLAAHVAPTLSEEAQYPDRPLLVAAVFALSLALWLTLLLVGWNIRDRR